MMTDEHGTLTAEQVRTAIFNGSSYASYDGAQYYANGINMQAIADELNTQAERTCKDVHEPPRDTTFWPTLHFKCSRCGATHISIDYVYYCPNCGAKVVSE